MANIPKPDLERGNFICYADEPDIIADNSGGGGGGGVVFLVADFAGIGSPLEPKFSFNDVKNALDAGQAVFIKWADGRAEAGNVNYSLVGQIVFDETPGDKAYSVMAINGSNIYSFVASDPDALMVDDSQAG